MRKKARTAFGERLKQAREAKKLTQPQLAKLAGVAQGTVGEAETTAIGSKYTAVFASVLGVRAEWLSNGTGPMADTSTHRLSPDIAHAISALQQNELQKLEQVIRAHLGIATSSERNVTDTSTHPLKYELVTDETGTPVGKHSPFLDTLQGGDRHSAGSSTGKVPVPGSRKGPKRAA